MMNAATNDTTDDTTTGPESLPLTATDARVRRIVVAVDGSDSSIDALRKAAELAGPLSAAVEAVSVWQYPAAVVDTYPSSLWTPEEDAQATLNAAAATVFGENVPAWFSSSIRSGPAARELIAASDGAELLVVGSRGHGGFVGLMLGSVSTACAQYAHCPVLIMHKPRPPKDRKATAE